MKYGFDYILKLLKTDEKLIFLINYEVSKFGSIYWNDELYGPCIRIDSDMGSIKEFFYTFIKNDIEIKTLIGDNGLVVYIIKYNGSDDPVKHINDAINDLKYDNYTEFVDMNMDNPWVRIIIKNLK